VSSIDRSIVHSCVHLKGCTDGFKPFSTLTKKRKQEAHIHVVTCVCVSSSAEFHVILSNLSNNLRNRLNQNIEHCHYFLLLSFSFSTHPYLND
jgi:ABC-type uncharacterized transport system fused permease/ATPase subunit